VLKSDNLTTFLVSIVLKFGSLSLLEPSRTVQNCNGIALPYLGVKCIPLA